MKTIEISTVQQVKLEYNLASKGSRIVAFIIDISVFWVIIYFGIIFFAFSNYSGDTRFAKLLSVIFVFIFIFYSFSMEFLSKGRSLGKWLMKIRIIQFNGDPPSLIQLLSRWMFRFIDFYLSFGSIAIISIDGTPFSQRLGDLMAGTVVIKTNENKDISLKDILNRNNETPEIKFTNAAKLNEQTMLLIKESLMYAANHPDNKALQESVQLLCNTIGPELNYNFSVHPITQLDELKQLLKDYVSLTR